MASIQDDLKMALHIILQAQHTLAVQDAEIMRLRAELLRTREETVNLTIEKHHVAKPTK